MKKLLFISLCILMSTSSIATIHIVRVVDSTLSFVQQDITITLGDTVQWLPMDVPIMDHTVTSTNIPVGAAAFDQPWEAPADTFFQYIPAIVGLYEYICTPHVTDGMIGSIMVVADTIGLAENDASFGIMAYPNPALNSIFITEKNTGFPYKIYDIKGSVILAGISEEEIDISMLIQGIYILEIIADKPRIHQFEKK